MHESTARRVRQLSTQRTTAGKSVLYIMSRDQRADDNHALLAAQAHALAAKLPLAVVFCLYPGSGYRSREQYDWMLHNLAKVETQLAAQNIPFILVIGKPSVVLPNVYGRYKPAALYFDFSPLKGPRRVVRQAVDETDAAVFVVDTHNVVPCWTASTKQEVGARTLRPKIHAVLHEFVVEPELLQKHPFEWPGTYMPLTELSDHVKQALQHVPFAGVQIGDPQDPLPLLDAFIHRIDAYDTGRNNPAQDVQSGLSPYLHFGQLSSVRILLALQAARAWDAAAAFIEELVVRKELADNYCFYTPQPYDSLRALPAWAQRSLAAHLQDAREHTYTLQQLEDAETHDPAWNAAQRQLRITGKMHGYMRMYWAKKVLEWSPSQPRRENIVATHPFAAILTERLSNSAGADWATAALVFLNDFYSTDGGDPNGYANILWSVGGLHDRPWGERPIFGVVRYMNYAGLKRKFPIAEYELQWQSFTNKVK